MIEWVIIAKNITTQEFQTRQFVLIDSCLWETTTYREGLVLCQFYCGGRSYSIQVFQRYSHGGSDLDRLPE